MCRGALMIGNVCVLPVVGVVVTSWLQTVTIRPWMTGSFPGRDLITILRVTIVNSVSGISWNPIGDSALGFVRSHSS